MDSAIIPLLKSTGERQMSYDIIYIKSGAPTNGTYLQNRNRLTITENKSIGAAEWTMRVP